MGIRIHKVLGYGFERSKWDKDSRFTDGFIAKGMYENLDIDAFISFLEDKKKEQGGWFGCSFELNDLKTGKVKLYDGSDFIKGDTELSHCSPLVFTNPFYKDWYRFDDDIDYLENCQRHKGIKDELIIPKNEGGGLAYIYPYASYVNRKTGERVHNVDYMYENDRNIVPKPPDIIINFCEFKNVFKNPLTVYRLKPMLYTYWS